MEFKAAQIFLLSSLITDVFGLKTSLTINEIWEQNVQNTPPWGYEKTLNSKKENFEFFKDLFRFLKVDPKLYCDPQNGDIAIFKNKEKLKAELGKHHYLEKRLDEVEGTLETFKEAQCNTKLLNDWHEKLLKMALITNLYKNLNPEIFQKLQKMYTDLKIEIDAQRKELNKTDSQKKTDAREAQAKIQREIAEFLKYTASQNPLGAKNIPEAYRQVLWDLISITSLNKISDLEGILQRLKDNINRSNKENFVAGKVLEGGTQENIKNVKKMLLKHRLKRPFVEGTVGVSDAVQIIQRIAELSDIDFIKDVTPEIITEFASLRDLFGIEYQEIKTKEDLAYIQNEAQKIAKNALKSME